MDSRRLRKLQRMAVAAVTGLAAAALAACGSVATGGDAAANYSPIEGSNVHLLITAWPQALDPQADSSPQGKAFDWQAYTGLTTFNHASGAAGLRVIPGLATALPSVSDRGRRYTTTLRPRLVYSNGRRVQASDFEFTVERAIRLHWSGAAAFLEPLIKGAAAYAAGRAPAISGIVADNRRGTITINLTRPFPAFDEILAQTALGLVPAGTPMHVEPLVPPAGVGPYVITRVVPKATLQLAPNPLWAQMRIPGIPAGTTAINVRLDSDVAGAALSVLNNSADLFDPDNVILQRLAQEIRRLAPTRLQIADTGAISDYVFMNVQEPPFDNPLVRRAVSLGLDRDALAAEGQGLVTPACTLLPPAIVGHLRHGSCSLHGNLATARALIHRSGREGASVTVWSPPTRPGLAWMTAYTAMLNSIGLKATLRVVNTDWSDYWTKVGSAAARAQTGYGSWSQSFASPLSFYGTLLYGGSIAPANNRDLSHVDDPAINSAILRLGAGSAASAEPQGASPASAAGAGWRALERRLEHQNYLAVIGYRSTPLLISNRVIDDFAAISSPIYGWDFSRVALKPAYTH